MYYMFFILFYLLHCWFFISFFLNRRESFHFLLHFHFFNFLSLLFQLLFLFHLLFSSQESSNGFLLNLRLLEESILRLNNLRILFLKLLPLLNKRVLLLLVRRKTLLWSLHLMNRFLHLGRRLYRLLDVLWRNFAICNWDYRVKRGHSCLLKRNCLNRLHVCVSGLWT